MGGRTIPAGTAVAGPVAVAGGPLHVYGTVNGDAIAIGSDVFVHPGARITGNAVSALGSVTLVGGTVGGEIRQLAGALGAVAASSRSGIASAQHAPCTRTVIELADHPRADGDRRAAVRRRLSRRRRGFPRGPIRPLVLGGHRDTAGTRAGALPTRHRPRGHDSRRTAHSVRDRGVRARGCGDDHARVPRHRAHHRRIGRTGRKQALFGARRSPSGARGWRVHLHGALGARVGVHVGTDA